MQAGQPAISSRTLVTKASRRLQTKDLLGVSFYSTAIVCQALGLQRQIGWGPCLQRISILREKTEGQYETERCKGWREVPLTSEEDAESRMEAGMWESWDSALCLTSVSREDKKENGGRSSSSHGVGWSRKGAFKHRAFRYRPLL